MQYICKSAILIRLGIGSYYKKLPLGSWNNSYLGFVYKAHRLSNSRGKNERKCVVCGFKGKFWRKREFHSCSPQITCLKWSVMRPAIMWNTWSGTRVTVFIQEHSILLSQATLLHVLFTYVMHFVKTVQFNSLDSPV